jgi:hypothetical protein
MTSRNASFRDALIPRLFFAPLRWLFCAVLLFLGLLLAAWIIDCVLVFWVWPEGIARLESILAQDYRLAMEWAALQHGRPEFVPRVANLVYGGIFERTGLHGIGVEFAGGCALSIPDSILRRAYVSRYETIKVAMIGTRLLGVRVAFSLMFMPRVLLLYALGLADDLVQRAIRRSSGGRESSSLYHRATYASYACIVAFVLVVVLAPHLPGLHILMPLSALVLMVAARLQWIYYKKHL